jgi:hypothetical protein
VPARRYVASNPVLATTVVGSGTSIVSSLATASSCAPQPAQHHLPANVLVCCDPTARTRVRYTSEFETVGPSGTRPYRQVTNARRRGADAERVLDEREPSRNGLGERDLAQLVAEPFVSELSCATSRSTVAVDAATGSGRCERVAQIPEAMQTGASASVAMRNVAGSARTPRTRVGVTTVARITQASRSLGAT